MSRTITISDETYERLERLAQETNQTPEEVLAQELAFIELRKGSKLIFHYTFPKDSPDSIAVQFLRALGMDNDQIAALQALPPEQWARETNLLLLTALLEDAIEPRNPLTAPRHLTFDEFFRELGHTDEEIADAKQRGAERANL